MARRRSRYECGACPLGGLADALKRDFSSTCGRVVDLVATGAADTLVEALDARADNLHDLHHQVGEHDPLEDIR